MNYYQIDLPEGGMFPLEQEHLLFVEKLFRTLKWQLCKNYPPPPLNNFVEGENIDYQLEGKEVVAYIPIKLQ